MQEDVCDALGCPQLKPLPAPYRRALRLLGRAPSQVHTANAHVANAHRDASRVSHGATENGP
jgi:beta-phosphoglucomutase-like phosphatase (HAD superfamily)